MFDGIPLPIAVKQEIPEALAWRDAWEKNSSDERKSFYCFHPKLRNWVGGAEDGVDIVHEAQAAWGKNVWEGTGDDN